MLTFSETKTKVYMKKSLFRLTDLLELCLAYSFCFSLNLLMDYAKTLDLDAYILKAFLKNFIDYQPLIVSLFTFIVIAFHYQMLERKKAEIFAEYLWEVLCLTSPFDICWTVSRCSFLFIFYRF